MADEFDGTEFFGSRDENEGKKGEEKPYLPFSTDELDIHKFADPERSFFKLFKSMFWPF